MDEVSYLDLTSGNTKAACSSNAAFVHSWELRTIDYEDRASRCDGAMNRTPRPRIE